MSSQFFWFRNMMGQKLADEEMGQIKYPRMELYTHVTFKTIQAGALLGMVLIAPAVRLVSGPRTLNAISETALRYGRNGALIGIPLGPLMTYGRATSGDGLNEDGFIDRAYRLRYVCTTDVCSVLEVIIYTKKSLNSDWLRKECKMCNMSAKCIIHQCNKCTYSANFTSKFWSMIG